MRIAMRLLLGFALALYAMAGAQAATLRWAARGDAGSMDPHAFNEGMTNNLNGLIHETLARVARDQKRVPALALGWRVLDDKTWRFMLRPGVKFHDGTPFSADDVVFSIERAQQSSSQQAFFARKLGRPLRIDDLTVELRLDAPNPLLIEHQLNVLMMSRAWCIEHGVQRVPDFNRGEEAYSSRHAMGTGPYRLKSREPGIRTLLVRNPNWWDRFEGNVDEAVFTPIGNDATRTAALLSNGIDFTHDAPPHDLTRLAREPQVRISSGPENRVIFFGVDQRRDELLYSSVKGRNPFKDIRVREALLRAVDAEAIRTSIMRGHSTPTLCMTPAPIGCLAPELEQRAPADLSRARKLMAEAGYGDGFELTLDCPNDRYINDQAICVAVAGMLGRIGVKVRVDARPKTLYFQKILQRDTSFWMLGWGGGTTDAQSVMDPILHSPDDKTQRGGDNHAQYEDAELDRMIEAAGVEMDTERRGALIAQVLRRTSERYYYLPLHRQMLSWVSRANVKPVVMPDNSVRLQWIQVD